jgi:hypothetical protein
VTPRSLGGGDIRSFAVRGSMQAEKRRLEEKSDLGARQPDPGEQGGVESASAAAHDGFRPSSPMLQPLQG